MNNNKHSMLRGMHSSDNTDSDEDTIMVSLRKLHGVYTHSKRVYEELKHMHISSNHIKDIVEKVVIDLRVTYNIIHEIMPDTSHESAHKHSGDELFLSRDKLKISYEHINRAYKSMDHIRGKSEHINVSTARLLDIRDNLCELIFGK